MKRMLLLLAGVMVCAGALLAQKPAEEKPRFRGAEVISAVEVAYPWNSIAEGTVILEVTVDHWGEIEDVRVLRDVPSLTEPARKAVKKWKFKPATLNGKPVTATIPVAFAFRTQVIVSPQAQ